MTIPQIYARLLRLYPCAFYERFGEEMQTVFATAWAERPAGVFAAFAFCLREFSGLLISLIHEHSHKQESTMLSKWFRRLRVPLALLFISLLVGGSWSLSYWGYLAQPSSIFARMEQSESFALVRFDVEFRATPVPISAPPTLTTPVFPPSQILPLLYARNPQLLIDRTLEADFVDQLAQALAREDINLGYPVTSYPPQPIVNPEGCIGCFQPGIQPQADGTLLELMPEIDNEGRFTGEHVAISVTPDDWWYYRYIFPAGYVVRGRDADGTPLVFVGLTSNALGGDSYRYHEFIFVAQGDRWVTQEQMNYRFDISGFEGVTFAYVTLMLFSLLLIIWASVMLVTLVLRTIWQRFRPNALNPA
jgi:hypothetical protein